MISVGTGGCKRPLEGVLKRRNDLFEIAWQFHVAPDDRPKRDWRRQQL
jgi:hypothetical protein